MTVTAGASGKKSRRKKSRYVARLEGGALVVSHDADLPQVCLKCGTHDEITPRPTTFYWTPRWARALMFLGIGLLLMLVLRAEADLAVPLCRRCSARWAASRHATVLAVLAVVAAIVVARLAESQRLIVGLVAFGVVLVVIAANRYGRPRTLRVKQIDAEHHVHLIGFDPAAAQEIVDGSR